MPIRAMRPPADLVTLADMLSKTFQYPEHPEWGIREDEQQDIARTIDSLRRTWPVLGVLRRVSPSLRDLLRGYVWEEEGEIAGVLLCQRQGSTGVWTVAIVGVLPPYRGRGIARWLVQHALDDLRSRGCVRVVLGVINRNVPAYQLYRSVGFEPYGGVIEFDAEGGPPPDLPPLPDGYEQHPIKRSDSWRVRYDLDRRINPPELIRFQPVVLGRYRPSFPIRLLGPILQRLEHRNQRTIRIDHGTNDRTVAWGKVDVPTRPGGVSAISIRLDPAHPGLADYVVRYHLHRALTLGPGRRVDLMVPDWMTAVAEAAGRVGFQQRLVYHQLGLTLSSSSMTLARHGRSA